MVNLSGNRISRVYRDGPWIVKSYPGIVYLAHNEWRGLSLMKDSGFVPNAVRVDDETIKMMFVQSDSCCNPGRFIENCRLFLEYMKSVNLIHGDLTEPHVFVVNNKPIVIDWAESRVSQDSAPPKRPEGDLFWMQRTSELIMKKLGIEYSSYNLGTSARG